MAWPPSLEALKIDLGVNDTRQDAQYKQVLDAAVSYVERVRAGDFNFFGDVVSKLPAPTSDLQLGAIRLAGRWHERRNSPEMLMVGAQFGGARVPSFDPDIDRLLGIGRFAKAKFA